MITLFARAEPSCCHVVFGIAAATIISIAMVSHTASLSLSLSLGLICMLHPNCATSSDLASLISTRVCCDSSGSVRRVKRQWPGSTSPAAAASTPSPKANPEPARPHYLLLCWSVVRCSTGRATVSSAVLTSHDSSPLSPSYSCC